jgi:putative CocE/NonD family hydrolase
LDGAGYIYSSGTLTQTIGRGQDTYIYDPRDSSIAAVEANLLNPLCLRPTFPTEDLTDQRVLIAMEGKQLIYHSAPFTEATEISGFFRLSAWISIDQPDTDFMLSIYEVDADGRSLMLTTDMLRARYRQGLRAENLVRSAEPLRYDFERFTFVSRLVEPGCRLRLVLGPINSIHYQRNYNAGGIVADESVAGARSVTVRLFHDEDHPSTLYVPIGQTES